LPSAFAIFAAEREALNEAQRDQDDRRGDSRTRIGRQQADQEGAQAHQSHRHQEGVLPADQVTDAAKQQRAERADRKSGREREQREDESRGRVDARKELLGENHAERAVNVEVVPFEHGAE
jgi:hypothetical protein